MITLMNCARCAVIPPLFTHLCSFLCVAYFPFLMVHCFRIGLTTVILKGYNSCSGLTGGIQILPNHAKNQNSSVQFGGISNPFNPPTIDYMKTTEFLLRHYTSSGVSKRKVSQDARQRLSDNVLPTTCVCVCVLVCKVAKLVVVQGKYCRNTCNRPHSPSPHPTPPPTHGSLGSASDYFFNIVYRVGWAREATSCCKRDGGQRIVTE